MSVAPFAMLGPDRIRSVIAGFGDPKEQLLPDGECEGVLLLDFDKRLLMIETCHGVASPPPVHRAFLHLLRQRWRGWTVRWAYAGMSEVAKAIGHVAGKHTWGFFQLRYKDHVYLDHSISAADVQSARLDAIDSDVCVVTTKTGAAEIQNYLLAHEVSSVLSVGPDLMRALDTCDAEPLPNEQQAIQYGIESGAFIDATSHRLWVHHWSILEPGNIQEVEERWPNWSVRANTVGVLLHAFLSGEDPETLKLPDEKAISQLAHELGEGLDLDPRAPLASAVEICSEAVA
jgi:hypothetical protein